MAQGRDVDTVWVSAGLTKNIGNYESLRLDCGATFVVRDGETVEQTYDRAWDQVDAQLEAKVAEAAEDLES